jgi:hypothetical protein
LAKSALNVIFFRPQVSRFSEELRRATSVRVSVCCVAWKDAIPDIQQYRTIFVLFRQWEIPLVEGRPRNGPGVEAIAMTV